MKPWIPMYVLAVGVSAGAVAYSQCPPVDIGEFTEAPWGALSLGSPWCFMTYGKPYCGYYECEAFPCRTSVIQDCTDATTEEMEMYAMMFCENSHTCP